MSDELPSVLGKYSSALALEKIPSAEAPEHRYALHSRVLRRVHVYVGIPHVYRLTPLESELAQSGEHRVGGRLLFYSRRLALAYRYLDMLGEAARAQLLYRGIEFV